MALDFDVTDVIHKITCTFVHAFLPDAKKPYYLKEVHQPELDVHGVAVNEPRTLKVLVPAGLTEGTAYQIAIETWSSARKAGTLLKKARDMRADFTLTAQK